jgi:hypothetical protein
MFIDELQKQRENALKLNICINEFPNLLEFQNYDILH